MDGIGRHKLEQPIPRRVDQTHAEEDYDIRDQGPRLSGPPPSYQANECQSQPRQMAPVRSYLSGVQAIPSLQVRSTWTTPKSKAKVAALIACVSVVLAGFVVWYIGLHFHAVAGEETMRLELVRRFNGQPCPTTFSALSGLYMIPSPTITTDWMRADQPQVKQNLCTTTTRASTASGPNRIAETHTREAANKNHESELVARKKEITFSRWGVEILYKFHRRAVKHAMQIQKAWCMDSVCSKIKASNIMCRKKRADMDRLGQQECDWCWNEHFGGGRSLTQRNEISKHCEVVSRHATVFLVAICGLFLILTLGIIIRLMTRMLRHSGSSEAVISMGNPIKGHRPQEYWPSQWMSNRTKHSARAGFSNQGVPLNRPQPANERLRIPIVRSAVSKSSRRSGAMSSGSEEIRLTESVAMARRPLEGKHGPPETEKDATPATGPVIRG